MWLHFIFSPFPFSMPSFEISKKIDKNGDKKSFWWCYGRQFGLQKRAGAWKVKFRFCVFGLKSKVSLDFAWVVFSTLWIDNNESRSKDSVLLIGEKWHKQLCYLKTTAFFADVPSRKCWGSLVILYISNGRRGFLLLMINIIFHL